MSRGAFAVLAAVTMTVHSGTAGQDPAGTPSIRSVLADLLAPALPYPRAREDGTPENGDTSALWTVIWPLDAEARVEVVANPLNLENQKRAAAAEAQIQGAAMRSQQRSQGDYERAVAQFARGDRPGPVREVSLDDDGVAGERFDADARLLIEVVVDPAGTVFSVASSVEPRVDPAVRGAVAVVVPANTYTEPGVNGELSRTRFAAAQARVYVGGVSPPVVRKRGDADRYDVTVPLASGDTVGHRVAVTLSGNSTLVDQVLERADWARLQALLAP
jgi:hypothetical protein